MSYRTPLSTLATLVALLIVGAAARTPAAAAEQDTGTISQDTCVLEILVPPSATVTINGKDYGKQRRIVYRPLEPAKTYSSRVEIDFPDGGRETLSVLIQGGRVVRLSVSTPKKRRPTPVLQLGHSFRIDSTAVSANGKYLMTGSQAGGECIIWDLTTKKALQSLPSGDCSQYLALSADGRQAVTAKRDRALLWNTVEETKSEAELPTGYRIAGAAYDANDRPLLMGTRERQALLWEANSGKPVRPFSSLPERTDRVTFSPDGKWLLVLDANENTAVLWNAVSGDKMRVFDGDGSDVYFAALHPEGKRIVTCSRKNLILWDVETGRSIQTFPGHRAVFGPRIDSQLVIPGGLHGVSIWDVDTGAVLDQIETSPGTDPSSSGAFFVRFGPDGRQVLTAFGDKVILWDTNAGQKVAGSQWQRFGDAALTADRGAIGVIEKHVDRNSPGALWHRDVQVWNLITRERLRDPDNMHITFRAGNMANSKLAILSPNGERLLLGIEGAAPEPAEPRSRPDPNREEIDEPNHPNLLGSGRTEAAVYDTTNGRQICKLDVVVKSPWSPAASFSPSGKQLAIVVGGSFTRDRSVATFDAASGKRLQSIEIGNIVVSCLDFSPDGEWILACYDNTVAIWEARTGRKLHSLKWDRSKAQTAVFHPDGTWVLAGYSDGTLILWDTVSGKRLRNLEGHSDVVQSVDISPDGIHALAGARDQTIRLWDLLTGEQLARIMAVGRPGQDWLVVTPDGLFDGSHVRREQVSFRLPGTLEVVSVDRFFQDYYYPGLFAALWRGERPKPNVEFGASRPPLVNVIEPSRGGIVESDVVTATVEAVDQGGGVRGPWLVQNGTRVIAPGTTEREGKIVRRTFEVSLVGGENQLEFRAASADGSWESEPATITLRYEKPLRKPELFLLCVGINRYVQASMKLDYAAPDAQAIEQLFNDRGPDLYQLVHIKTLLDEEATRPAIVAALRNLATEAGPQDTVVVFLAGHGSVVGQRYYFLPHGFRRTNGTLTEDVQKQGLLASDIGGAMIRVPALKRMAIFDTGQSGAYAELRRTTRDPFAFRGTIERLARANGTFTIATAAVSEQAQEVKELEHGVLTYSLLAGLRAVERGPLKDQAVRPSGENQVARVLEWFGFASTHVPRLTRQYFGQSQDIQHSSLGMNFPVLPIPAGGAGQPVLVPVEPLPDDEPTTETTSEFPPPSPGQSNLHLVAVGINQYADSAMNLKFARADAETIANLFRRRGGKVFRETNVHEVIDAQATTQGILDKLNSVAQRAKADDTLAVFLTGHGRMVGQRYYFIPHDFRRTQGLLENDIRQQGLPADVLGDAVAKIPASKRLLIVGTCASGGALKLNRQGHDPYAFRGAIEQLGRQQGVFTIAASSAGAEAHEIKDLGHGVLTYALLAGMKAVPPDGPLEGLHVQPNNPDGTVDVLEWFSYASGHVPRLTKRYLGVEQDVQMSGQGRSFAVLPLAD